MPCIMRLVKLLTNVYLTSEDGLFSCRGITSGVTESRNGGKGVSEEEEEDEDGWSLDFGRQTYELQKQE